MKGEIALRTLGASDKFFYYTSSNRTTFSIRISLVFRALDAEAFRLAAEDALNRYPEYAYRPVVSNNRLFAEENRAPIVFAPEEEGRVYHFGTKDTNGYLFYFTWRDSTVTLTYYHGLTDVMGMLEFLRCLAACYGERTGFAFTEEEKREMEGLFRSAPLSAADWVTDPYNTAGNASAVPEYAYPFPAAYAIPGDYPADSEEIHEFRLSLSVSAFLRKTKELGVSAIPLLSSLISGAVVSAYDTRETPVVAMVPANMRPLLQVNTPVNFSDGLFLPFEKADAGLPLSERCAKAKTVMRAQATANNFRHMAGAKAGTVAGFEADPTPIADQARAKTQLPPPDAFRPVSYAITYPGNMSLSKGLDRLLEDLRASMWVRGNSIFGYSFGDRLELVLKCRTDDNTWPESVRKAFGEIGLETELHDSGRLTGPRMYPEELMQK